MDMRTGKGGSVSLNDNAKDSKKILSVLIVSEYFVSRIAP